MNSKIIPIRRDVLPENIFNVIDGYMHGTIKAIHIIAVTDKDEIITSSAGAIPPALSRWDTKLAG